MKETVVCVGAIVRRGSRLLLVRQAAGHSLAGQWTIPWGRLGRGESPTAAVLREIREEGGIKAEVESLLGVQELPSPWDGQVAILFLCKHVDGEPKPDFHETDAAGYCSDADFTKLGESVEPLSNWLGRRFYNGHFTSMSPDQTNPFHPTPGYF